MSLKLNCGVSKKILSRSARIAWLRIGTARANRGCSSLRSGRRW